MHYSCLVLIEKPETIGEESVKAAVEAAMDGYGDGQVWDWYQIGGRWTGLLDGYDPETDPANAELCDLCGGSGDRAKHRGEPREGQHPKGCNGCEGKGARTKWPTQWRFREGDVVPVENVTDEHLKRVHAVCADGYGIQTSKVYRPFAKDDEHFPRLPMPDAAYLHAKFAGHLAVVVDYHN